MIILKLFYIILKYNKPFVCLYIWVFYDEVLIAEIYEIPKEGYLFYFIFVVLLWITQMTIDVLFDNMYEQYKECKFLEYL